MSNYITPPLTLNDSCIICGDEKALHFVSCCGKPYHLKCLEIWIANKPTCPCCCQKLTLGEKNLFRISLSDVKQEIVTLNPRKSSRLFLLKSAVGVHKLFFLSLPLALACKKSTLSSLERVLNPILILFSVATMVNNFRFATKRLPYEHTEEDEYRRLQVGLSVIPLYIYYNFTTQCLENVLSPKTPTAYKVAAYAGQLVASSCFIAIVHCTARSTQDRIWTIMT